jgi:hypothetical protein
MPTRAHTTRRAVIARMLVTAAVATAALAGCASDRPVVAAAATAPVAPPVGATGPSRAMGEGSAWTYVLSDTAGTPLEVGVRMTGAALRGLPSQLAGTHAAPVVLDFPAGSATGVLNHVELYWEPTGHEPAGIWDKPHFDYHFFLTDVASSEAIDPSAANFEVRAANLPDTKYLPADFTAPPGPAASNTIPMMGLHWFDKTVTRIPGSYRFTQEVLEGSWDGEVTFIEPMITRDWLLTHPSLEQQLKLPAAYQRSGLYPTTYSVRYDRERDEYTVALGGFTQRTAS